MTIKEIRGLGGRYSVDEDGNVFSHISGIRLKPCLMSEGYHYVRLAGKNRLIHRLVTEAFLPDFLDKPQVNHIDGDKLNNRISNLEMATAKENTLHSFKARLQVSLKGEKHGSAKLSNEDVITIKSLLLKGETGSSIAKKFGVGHNAISDIKLGKKWRHIT